MDALVSAALHEIAVEALQGEFLLMPIFYSFCRNCSNLELIFDLLRVIRVLLAKAMVRITGSCSYF